MRKLGTAFSEVHFFSTYFVKLVLANVPLAT